MEYSALIVKVIEYPEVLESIEYGEKFAEHYTKQKREDMFWYTWLHDTIIKSVKPKSSDVIVDLGCGNAALSVKLAKKVKKVIGVDLSEAMVNEGRKTIAELGLKNISFKISPVESVTFPRNSIDAVTTNLAIDHVKDKLAMARKVYGWLKPGGKFAIGLAFKSKERYQAIVKRKRERYPHLAKRSDESYELHKKRASNAYYTKSPLEFKVDPYELAAILQEAGFKARVIPHFHHWFGVVVGEK